MLKVLIAILIIATVAIGAIVEYNPFGYALDGRLTKGEYAEDVILTERSVLNVSGGGAYNIEANDYSYINIESTSLPLSSDNSKGVWRITLSGYSNLNFSGGATNSIYTGGKSTTLLSGGQINFLYSQQRITDGKHITIDCKDNWLWKYNSNNQIKGIVGYWHNGTPFDITFIDDSSNYFPATWKNVEVIPEPATLALLTLGGVLINKRRRQ